ncbi:MAG TPA: c-type cytochrome [Gemmatimonadales bacterium]
MFAASAVAQDEAGPTRRASEGAAVFEAKGCAACHALTGRGSPNGPDLSRPAAERSFFDLAAALWNHLPAMGQRLPAEDGVAPTLTPEEANNVAAFLYTLNYFDPPGNPNVGQRLFGEKQCRTCHQVQRTGGTEGPDLDFLGLGSPVHIATAMWNHAAAMQQKMEDRRIVRADISGRELNDIIAYIRFASVRAGGGPTFALAGRADEGRRLFREYRCVHCHAVGGEGGSAGLDLADRSRNMSLLDFSAAMWNKAPAMLARADAAGIEIPALGAAELADVIAYLYATRYFRERGDATAGRALLASKGCVGCHSVAGEGGGAASDLGQPGTSRTSAAALAAMWNHLAVRRDVTEGGTWPSLSPQNMADLLVFLRTP